MEPARTILMLFWEGHPWRAAKCYARVDDAYIIFILYMILCIDTMQWPIYRSIIGINHLLSANGGVQHLFYNEVYVLSRHVSKWSILFCPIWWNPSFKAQMLDPPWRSSSNQHGLKDFENRSTTVHLVHKYLRKYLHSTPHSNLHKT